MDLNTFIRSEDAPSVAELAKMAEVPHVAQINQWLNPRLNRRPGGKYCVNLERATRGLITCEELNPDLNWRRIPDVYWPWHPDGRPLIDPLPIATAPEASIGAASC